MALGAHDFSATARFNNSPYTFTVFGSSLIHYRLRDKRDGARPMKIVLIFCSFVSSGCWIGMALHFSVRYTFPNVVRRTGCSPLTRAQELRDGFPRGANFAIG